MKKWQVSESITDILLALKVLDFSERQKKHKAIMKILFEETK